MVRRSFGPEDLEEYGAARTEQYFARGKSVDEAGDSHIEVRVAGAPVNLNVTLLGANARKDLAREGRVPPSQDEQIMTVVRAWWKGDQRVVDLLTAPVRTPAQQREARRKGLNKKTEQELMAARTALRTFWREKT